VQSDVAPDPARVDVVLSGRVLDGPPEALPRAGVSVPYLAPGRGAEPAVDPGTPGPHEIVTSDYRLPATPIAGLPARVEMLGHVVRPVDTTVDHPLVVFLHGRHAPCFGRPVGAWRDWPCPRGMRPVPSHLGYHYVQRLLARQGYVTVSVSANGINAQDYRVADGGASARAALVRRHLTQWAGWAEEGRYAVDLRRVVLVGHSRGGEGVNRAALRTALPAPYRFVGQVLIAPTNFARQAAGYVPTVTLLPYCDGDVVDLQGQSFTDIARDLAADDAALRSSVMVMGANHNYFNTEWTPGISVAPSFDDWFGEPNQLCGRGHPSRLRAIEQRAVGRTYIAGAVHLFAAADSRVLPMYDGSNVDVPSAGRADVRTHAVGGGRELRRPGGLSPGPAVGASTRLCAGRAGSDRPSICGRGVFEFRTPHWIPDSPATRGAPTHQAFEMRWNAAGGTGGLDLARPMDLSGATRLDLRTVVDPTLGGVRLRVRLVDSAGAATPLLVPAGRGFLPALPGAGVLGKMWAQTLQVPLGGVSGVDLSEVTRLDLVGVSADGAVHVLDLAAVAPGLPPVPVRRLARIDLRTIDVVEGDGPGTAVMRVPFQVSGVVPEPSRFVVLAQNQTDGTVLPPVRVDLLPGQADGTVDLPYLPDTRDDLPFQHITLTALAVRGVMPDRYLTVARLLDDDPPPRAAIERVSSRVAEGGAARWRVTLSDPVDYHATVIGRIVAGATGVPRVSLGDVPARWRSDHVFPVPALSTPLHQAGIVLFGSIPPGGLTATMAIPLRRDGAAEGRESVTLRIRLPRLADPAERSVFVLDPG
jgi:hypothetical protein